MQDPWIHDVVKGKFLEFVSIPFQTVPPRPLALSRADDQTLNDALYQFLKQSIVELCLPEDHGFVSHHKAGSGRRGLS